MKVQVKSFAAILLAQAPFAAVAGEPAPVTPMPQIVVAGTLSDTGARREFVAGKIIIGRKRIAESGLRKVDELLRREPAVTVTSDGRIGLLNLPGYTQVLIDGRQPVGQSVGDLDLVHVERIEIVKGSVAEFGAFSIAGTINIVTRIVSRKTATEVSAGLQSQGGKGGAEATLSHNVTTAGSPFRYSVEISADTDGFEGDSAFWQTFTRPGVREEAAEQWRGTMESRSRTRSAQVSSNLNWQLSDDRTVRIAPRFEGVREKGSFNEVRRWSDGAAWSASEVNTNVRDTISLPVIWTSKLGKSSNLEVSAFTVLLRSRKSEGRIDAGTVVRQIGETDSDVDAASRSLEVTYKTHLANGHDVKAGTRYFRQKFVLEDANLSEGLANPLMHAFGRSSRSLSKHLRVFLQDEWQLNEKLALNAGLTGENITSDLSAGQIRGSNAFHLWSPSLHISHKIGSDEKRQVRLGLARSYRAPEYTALGLRGSINAWAPCSPLSGCGGNSIDTPDRMGSVTLRPERALSIDLSYERGYGNDSQVTLAVFGRSIQDKIGEQTVLDAVPWADVPRYVVRPANLGQARSLGGSIEMDIALPDLYDDAPKLTVRGSLNLARSKVSDLPGPDNRLDKQSPRSAKLGATYEFTTWPLAVDVDGQWTPSFASRTSMSNRVVAPCTFGLETSAKWQIGKGRRLMVNWSTSYPRSHSSLDQFIGADGMVGMHDFSSGPAVFKVQFETTL